MSKGAKLLKKIAENPDVPASAWLQSEAQFLAAVIECAQRYGWMVHHILDTAYHAKVIGPGFPDLVMVRGYRIVVAELKSQDAPAGLPLDQSEWIVAFQVCMEGNKGLQVYVWHPADWPEIEEVLG